MIRPGLDRQEPAKAGCRVNLVTGNDDDQAPEAGPPRTVKSSGKLFDRAEPPCAGLSSALVNDALGGRAASGS